MDPEVKETILRTHGPLIASPQLNPVNGKHFNPQSRMPKSQVQSNGHDSVQGSGPPSPTSDGTMRFTGESGPSSPTRGRNVSMAEESGPPSPASGLIKNFGEVEQGLYRSSFPGSCNMEHLKSLQLKTILTLVDTEYSAQEIEFMKETGITHRRILIPAHKDGNVIPNESIVQVMQILLNKENLPLLIHCNKGKHRTGCMIACYRTIQAMTTFYPYKDWNSSQVLEEYHQYAGDKSRLRDIAFIIDFETWHCSDIINAVSKPNCPRNLPLLPTAPESSEYDGADYESETRSLASFHEPHPPSRSESPQPPPQSHPPSSTESPQPTPQPTPHPPSQPPTQSSNLELSPTSSALDLELTRLDSPEFSPLHESVPASGLVREGGSRGLFGLGGWAEALAGVGGGFV